MNWKNKIFSSIVVWLKNKTDFYFYFLWLWCCDVLYVRCCKLQLLPGLGVENLMWLSFNVKWYEWWISSCMIAGKVMVLWTLICFLSYCVSGQHPSVNLGLCYWPCFLSLYAFRNIISFFGCFLVSG